MRLLPGIGPALARKLERLGITRLGHLQALDDRDALRKLGDGRSVPGPPRPRRGCRAASHPDRTSKSVSAETTFDTDLSRLEDLERPLWRLAEKLAPPPEAEDLAAGGVVLKLKTADFVAAHPRRPAAQPHRAAGPAVRRRPRPAGAGGDRHRRSG